MYELISSFWNRNRVFLISSLVIFPSLFILLCAGLWILGIRINVTQSLPIGFYILCDGPTQRGDLVFFSPTENHVIQWARDNGVLSRNYLIKRVYGIGGDEVAISDLGIYINGNLIMNSKILEREVSGRLIPNSAESGIIPDGYLWLMSEHTAFSFDSRYFGLVPCKNVKSRAKPLLTW